MQTPKINSIFDYVIELKGKYNYAANQVFAVKQKSEIIAKMIVISASEDKAYCLAKGKIENLSVGDAVSASKEESSVVTYKEMFGDIIDIDGNYIFGENKVFKNKYDGSNKAFNTPNKLLDYESLTTQLNTGYFSIDLLIPIGRGQRQLIIGDRKTGKTHIALNTIINQRNQNVKCIYVAIGQSQEQVALIYNLLKENNALDYTMIIDASSSNPYDQYLAPYIAMAHAENICEKEDVLIVFDSLTNHANIYREIALLTNKPVGKEAFPGDMFFAHSRLLERSGKFKGKKSISALPILQTTENDITSLIASNVISITDGQIVTNSELFASGKLPAIDIDLSVSRIGGNVQKPYIAKVAAEIGKIYHLYKRHIKLASLKYDLNDETNALIINGQLVENLFIQKGISIYSEASMYLTAKLIAWNILKGIDNIALAIQFIEHLIKADSVAKSSFEKLITSSEADETLIRDYFAFMFKTFSELNHLNWDIEAKQTFVISDSNLIQNISKQIIKGDNNGSQNN
ncbi:MSC_0619 family F1-like ATPase alpha subunit [Metamycoplasma neophronis]|uniref:ATP F0F1 synthase subunit alpha n=1 Tax=Metamycoplasma neophronis TaxID=872983 RepID=A0ABY2YZZ2_9BACT|nr:ATP F0F1 synthase subunit alpha [Metamycoplasma neophronis]TPR54060.1 ATP F0F1 synthase subunit alpha [Metamycoplasma neophronis]